MKHSASRVLGRCDGVIVSAPECVEPAETMAHMRDWCAQRRRKYYSLGPLLPSARQALEKEKSFSADAEAIEVFMQQTWRKSGEKSMVFVSVHLHRLKRTKENFQVSFSGVLRFAVLACRSK